MRSLTLLISAVLFTETLLYAALSPLLPALTREFGLGKSQAGLLVSAYAVGQIAVAVPLVYLVWRVGVKPLVVGGLVALAATTLAFALAANFQELLATRLLQGVAAALCWSGALAWLVEASPRERRGGIIGVAMGVAASGLVAGPAVGGLAAVAGRAAAFAAIALIVALLAAAVAGLRPPLLGGPQPSAMQMLAAHRSGRVLLGQALLLLPGLLVGTLGVLAPLRLYRLGFRPTGIAVTFLLAAATGILLRPLVGRWSDRRGRLAPVRLCLAASVPLGLLIPWVGSRWVLAVLVICAFTVYETLWGPTVALLADAYETAGITQGVGFAFMNIPGGSGLVIGSAVGGFAAHLLGDATVYTAMAGVCLMTFFALRRHRLAEKVSLSFAPGG